MVLKEIEVMEDQKEQRVIEVWLVCKVYPEAQEAVERKVFRATVDCKARLENLDHA